MLLDNYDGSSLFDRQCLLEYNVGLWIGGVVGWIHAAVTEIEDLFVDEQVTQS